MKPRCHKYLNQGLLLRKPNINYARFTKDFLSLIRVEVPGFVASPYIPKEIVYVL